MPKWADVVLVPLISLIIAALLSALLILAIGESPVAALKLMIEGTLLRSSGWGYMLYYTTNFIFTGLAVSVAFHAALFNIGGEGQAMMGGLGVALVCLFIPWPHWTFAIIGASLGAAFFGMIWAGLPAYLQAKRGSHIVITTIMFNFIAAGVLNFFLVGALKPKGSMDPATANFPAATHLPTFEDMAGLLGFEKMFRAAPANVSFFLALVACVLVWFLIWRTPFGV
jgi:simple sugar transport system permease protein